MAQVGICDIRLLVLLLLLLLIPSQVGLASQRIEKVPYCSRGIRV